MDPQVTAAIIAAGISGLTLVGTLAAQYLSYRATSKDAEKTAREQNQQLDRTLVEQREHLDRTLDAQNRQLDRTLDEQRTRTWNERFATAAEQLGDDKPPAVRLAGVYAIAGLADDWEANRQTCVDVLCAYLRMPYAPDPKRDRSTPEQLAFQSSREVRHTVIRVIAAHLKDSAMVSWQGLNFDFTGVVFDGGSFSNAKFSGGTVSFQYAKFSGGKVGFEKATFSGSAVDFSNAEFSGGTVRFWSAKFSGGEVNFFNVKFSGGEVSFIGAEFSGSTVRFWSTEFSGGEVNFHSTKFSGGDVSFIAEFSGSKVSFFGAKFPGGTVDFSGVIDWSFPPEFPWTDISPSGVKLPSAGEKAN